MADDEEPQGIDQRYPEWWRALKWRNHFYVAQRNGQKVAYTWPKKRGRSWNQEQHQKENDFRKLAAAQKAAYPPDQVGARLIAEGSQYTYRDVLGRALVGRLIEFTPINEDVLVADDIQGLLDQISDQPGAMLMRSPDQWVALVNPLSEDIIRWDPIDEMPVWAPIPDSGMTQLTGDVHAGPGTGSLPATLATTTVTPGAYTNTSLTVDTKGRLTTASSGTPAGRITQLTGDVTAGPTTGSAAATLSTTAVTPGSYTNTTLTVDTKGRLTAASSGSPAGRITELTGDVTAGPTTGPAATTLASTSVTPGTYTNANVTVDAKGRLTAAASGTSGYGTDLHPGYRTGQLYTRPINIPLANTAVVINRIYATPIYIGGNITIAQVSCWVTSFSASGLAAIGIYNNANGLPSTLLRDFGTVPTTTPNAQRNITGLAQPVSAGWYWFAIAVNQVCNLSSAGTLEQSLAVLLGMNNINASGVGWQYAQMNWTFAAGAMPSPFVLATYGATGPPIVAFAV